MPAYFFHLAFELHASRSSPEPTYTPPPTTDIFTSELPAHSRPWSAPAPHPKGYSSAIKSIASSSEAPTLPNPRRYSHRTRPSFSEHHHSPVPLVKPPTRAVRTSAKGLAHKDWRFDAISILSIDMKPADNADEATHARSKSLMHPAAGAGGLATKGKFIPSSPKDTEVGWGIVHLYRDGQETPGLYDDGVAAGFSEEDCTTLCILAVPSYMTPSDLLGFVGEQTREHVSHFRLIRTARANKYMVLMKFREAKKAREWRKEWNGKAFNSMEVCLVVSYKGNLVTYPSCSQNIAMLSLSNPLLSNPMRPTATPHPIPISRTILLLPQPRNSPLLHYQRPRMSPHQPKLIPFRPP